MIAAGGAGSILFACESAHAVITGISLVPVSFEQGWLDETGGPIVTGTSPTSISQDALMHARVASAWTASGAQYRTVRVYLETSDVGDGVNGAAGNELNPHIRLFFQPLRADWTWSDKGFFNYSPSTSQDEAGPQPFIVNNNAQGQRAYDTYLTVGTSEQAEGFGYPIEGDPTDFDAVRGSSVATPTTIGTGETGGLGGAIAIDCENCGYLSTLPIASQTYSYNTAASLTANGGNPISGQGVLIGQFTTSRNECLYCNLLAVYPGIGQYEDFEFSAFDYSCIPTPAGLALFGAAGGAMRRRRRRT